MAQLFYLIFIKGAFLKFFIFILLILSTSCANIVSISKTKTSRKKTSARSSKKIIKKKRIVRKIGPSNSSSNHSSLKLTFSNKSYKSWVNYFRGKSKSRFKRYVGRGEKYKKEIQTIFRSHGLPEDLYYVGLIESGYHLGARSHASAVGPWQFMRKTGQHYGLKVNSRIDERLDITKSTHAAAKYFKDLYNIFGNWELALCGYNAGEYGVIRAIRKGNTRNYISLSSKGLIPKETSNYIPKVAAARHVYREFLNNRVRKPKRNYKKRTTKMHKVRRGDTLYSISRKHGTSIHKIKRINKISGSHIYIGQKILVAYSKPPFQK